MVDMVEVNDIRDSIFSRLREINNKMTDMDEMLEQEKPTEWQLQAMKALQGHFTLALNILNNFAEPVAEDTC